MKACFFIAVDENEKAIGFVQLFPRLSSLQLQRYWQITDILCWNMLNKQKFMRR